MSLPQSNVVMFLIVYACMHVIRYSATQTFESLDVESSYLVTRDILREFS